MAKTVEGGKYINAAGDTVDANGEPIEEAQEEEEETSIFASPDAEALAEDNGLTADDFDGVDQSGKTGYTKADVDGVIKAQEE